MRFKRAFAASAQKNRCWYFPVKASNGYGKMWEMIEGGIRTVVCRHSRKWKIRLIEMERNGGRWIAKDRRIRTRKSIVVSSKKEML